MKNWREEAGKFRYAESPLLEALCEFGFAPGEDLSRELLDILEAHLGPDYPVRKSLRTFRAEIKLDENRMTQGVEEGERIQFVTEDGSNLVQVFPNTLTVNKLKPYSTWETFKPSILHALRIYQEVVGPSAIYRAHLRYVNMIELDGAVIELDDWFQFSFRQPEIVGLPGAAAYNVAAQYPLSEHATLRVQLSAGSRAGSDGKVVSALDLEYILLGENVLAFEDVPTWLDEAHRQVESAWLGSITEKLHFKYSPEVIK